MTITVANGVMTIVAPLSQGVLSKTGKSLIVASTSGFIPVEGTNYRVSLNVIKSH